VKRLQGSASASSAAPIERCIEVLAAVDRYPRWYPDVVRSVTVLERGPDERPARVEAVLHVARGPLVRDLELLLAVSVGELGEVVLRRIPHGPPDAEQFEVAWRLQTGVGDETSVAVALDASLSLPRLVPLGGLADAFAEGFLRAALVAIEQAG
jgi:hypothetical protein